MLSLNRISLIGNTGDDAKVVPNGPTTISLATNVSWTDKQTQERQLIYEKYPRKVEATVGKKTVEVEALTTVAKVKVQRLIRLESANTEGDPEQNEEGSC